MKQVNTLNKLVKSANRAKIGHVYNVVANYPLHDGGPTVGPITIQCLQEWPQMRHQVAYRLGVDLGRAIRTAR